MRIIARATLRKFWEKHADAEDVLINWHKRVQEADWTCFQDVKRMFASADVLPGNRVVFNIKGTRTG